MGWWSLKKKPAASYRDAGAVTAAEGGYRYTAMTVYAASPAQTPGSLTLEGLSHLLGEAYRSKSGAVVTPDTAIKVAAVYACVDRLCGAIKSLPFYVYGRREGVNQRVASELDFLFNVRAYADMSAAEAWQFVFMSKFFYGDGYAELLRPNRRSLRVIGWRPLHPAQVEPCRDRPGGDKAYRVTREDGSVETLPQDDVCQVTSLGYDGLTSPSPITYAARESVGAAMAAQDWSSEFFHQGAQFDFALQTDARMTDRQIQDLTEVLKARIRSNGRAPLLLSGGLKPAQLTINPKDAELLQSRRFTLEEICRIFGMPPHLIGHTEKSTSWNSGLEALGQSFVRYTLMPHLKQAEQEFSYKLFYRQAATTFFQFDTHALIRGETKDRFEAYRMALGRAGEPGFMTIDEVRERENLPPDERLNTQGATPSPEETHE
ncbi:phage portal protein [Vibrio coralliilyticus]|uniref:phage portal protein n=1 Tax=Vibrio coralliilyticus TaxID=190893 RepID=UPI0017C6A549|nr:phage portal protein [Vibrio coralliilyticus]NUW66951.1 phage portal protein [Vibrio coralliilyticus]NUW69145.1 phage portal protein [Vibrio coralliilyticus]